MTISEKDIFLYKSWQRSPIQFVHDMWRLEPERDNLKFEKGKHLTWQQQDILLAIEKAIKNEASPRISIRAGRGIGKTSTLSWIILWYLFCYKDAQIACTAPTAEQMNDALWKELNLWLGKMPKPIQDLYDWGPSHLRIKERSATWFARARTARKENPEALAGVHGEYVMLIADEACFDGKTEILTNKGFKFFTELTGNEFVLTMDPETKVAEYKKPTEIIKKYHEGELYYYKQRGADFAITPNHKMWVKSSTSDRWKIKEAKDIFTDNYYVNRVINWIGVEKESYTIPAFHNGRGKNGFYSSKDVPMDYWLQFLGWYLSEGNLMKRNKNNIGISIAQVKKENHVEIMACIEGIGYKGKLYDGRHINFTSRQLAEHIAGFGDGFLNKKIPSFVFDLSPRQIRIFLDVFRKGDGYKRGKSEIFYSSSKHLADGIQELLLKSGRCSTITTRQPGKTQWIIDHWGTTKYLGYVICAYTDNTNIKLRKRNLKKEQFKGMIYCANVPPHHLIFTRRNGYCMWSGNSGIDDNIFKIAEGALTGEHFLFITVSNPRRLTGYFYDAHKRSTRWQKLNFSSKESPIVKEGFIEEIKNKYGEDSDEYRIEVLGEFPKEDTMDETGYVPLFTRERTNFIEDGYDFRGSSMFDKFLGIDPAGEGKDKTVWIIRDSFIIKKVAEEIISTPKSIAEKTLTLLTYFGIKSDNCFIDGFGIGAQVAREIFSDKDTGKINVILTSQKPNNENYLNLRAELGMKFSQWIQTGGKLINRKDWEELFLIKFKRNLQGKIQIMEKLKMKKILGKSPDYFDAASLTFCNFRFLGEEIKEKVKQHRPSWAR